MPTDRRRQSAQDLLKAETGDIRSLRAHETYLVSAVAIGWALFQLSLGSILIIDSTKERSIHLAFALGLLFLVSPCLRRPVKYLGFLSVRDRIPFIDYLFAAAGAASALYLAVDYDGLAMRAGIPLTRDLVAGSILVILLLEATRRIIQGKRIWKLALQDLNQIFVVPPSF